MTFAPEQAPERNRRLPSFVRNYAFDLFLVLSNFLLRAPGHRLREAVLRRLVRVQLGEHVAVQRGVTVTSRGGVRIGARCQINRGVHLDGRGGLVIGSHVNVSPEVMFLTADHDPQSPDFDGRTRGVTISSRAWIATRALILPGAYVGEGALVAAGAVVHGEVPPWTIVAGNPAKVIGNRSPEAQQSVGPPYRRLFH